MNNHCKASEASIKEFGIKLRNIRKSKDLLLTDVANVLGIRDSTLSRWESGDRVPYSLEKLYQLSIALNVSIWDLSETLFPELTLYSSEYARIFPSICRRIEEQAFIDIYTYITNVTLNEEELDSLCIFIHNQCNEKITSKKYCRKDKEENMVEKDSIISLEDAKFGNFIRKYRLEKHLSVRKIADELGCSDNFFYQIEGGTKKLLNYTSWVELAKVLHISIWQLVDYRYPEFNVMEREVYGVLNKIKSKYEFEAISNILSEITLNHLSPDEIKQICMYVNNFCNMSGNISQKIEALPSAVEAERIKENERINIQRKFSEIASQLDETFTRNLDSSYYCLFANKLREKGFEAYSHNDGWIVFKVK